MGAESLKNQDTPKSPAEHEKSRILALIEIINKSNLVVRVDVIWASDLEQMAQTMSVEVLK